MGVGTAGGLAAADVRRGGQVAGQPQSREQARGIEQVVAKEVKPKVKEIRERLSQKGLLSEDVKNELDEMEKQIGRSYEEARQDVRRAGQADDRPEEEMRQEQSNLQRQVEGMQSALNKLSLAQMDEQGLVSKHPRR